MNKTRRDPHDTATLREVADAIHTMSQADRVRLAHFARLRAAGLPGLDWEDLLHEAIDRVLSGSRTWPLSVSMVAFMCGTIRSIAGDLWRERRRRPEVDLQATAEGGIDDDVPDESPGPERQVMARRTLGRILSLFEGDDEALAIVRGLADGSGPAEIQMSRGMTAKRYASAQKRIRRRISNMMAEQEIE
jgi:RNA polymerase sigma-70 factor (ECF subfamily)